MKKIVSFLALNLALGGGAIAAGTQIINDQGEIKAAPTTFTENSWIYAHWESIPYTANFYCLGISGSEDPSKTINDLTYNVSKLDLNDVTDCADADKSRPGYTLFGWIDQDGTEYTRETELLWEWDENRNFEGWWEPNKYQIALNPNGGTGGATTIYTTYDTGVYSDSQRMEPVTDSAALSPLPTRAYTVTFNANGGSVSPASAIATSAFNGFYNSRTGGTQYITNDGFLTQAGLSAATKTANSTTQWYAQWTPGSVSLPAATRTGYSFQGWGESSSATSGATGNRTPTKNETLYATWKPNNYTIALNDNGGTGGATTIYTTYDTAVYSDSAHTNELTDTVALSPLPTRAGYTFNGYYIDNTGGGDLYITADGFITNFGKTEATTIYDNSQSWYAGWTPNAYKAYFHCSRKDYDDGAEHADAKDATYDSTFTFPEMKTCTKQGYTFDGWSDGTKTYKAGETITWKEAGNNFFYAVQTANEYVIELDQNGGTGGWTNILEIYGSHFEYAGEPVTTVPVPTRKAFKFLGYFTEKE